MSAAGSLLESIDGWALTTPEAPALVKADDVLTYAELMQAVAALAAELTDAGVRAGDVVAVDCPPGPRSVVSIVAAHSLGAAFMLVDPSEGQARKQAMVTVAAPAALVDEHSVRALGGAQSLDSRLPQRHGAPAYVGFTSGSTGVPKGVVIEEPALRGYITTVVELYGLQPGDRQLQFSSIAFDIAIEEVFSTLCCGGTVVLRDEGFVFSRAKEFLLRCQQRGITVLNLPTGVWNRFGAELAAHPDLRLPPQLRRVIIGGEAADRSAMEAWFAAATHPEFAMFNMYGPTEACISVSAKKLAPGQPVTIGSPLPGVQMRLVGDGEAQEIAISGIAVGRGYLGQDSESFVDLDGQWTYLTGDHARINDAQEFEFAGRVDAQVKVRGGYRVELGEVAASIRGLPGVRDAHVMADRRAGGTVLLGFYVGDAQGVREQLAQLLPAAWMLPHRLVKVAEIPLTSRGKVDEKALHRRAKHTEASRFTDAAALVDAAWQHALGAAPASDEQSFFEAGGNSLSALEFVKFLQDRVGVAPPMMGMYRQPSRAGLVQLIQQAVAGDAVPAVHHTTGRALVKMRHGGKGRLWCFLPPLSGAVTRYAGFAASLPFGDAVWAMETPAELSGQGMGVLIDGLAKVLLAEDLSGFDSIIFSGYSLGGVFAYELAKRLDDPRVSALLLDPTDVAEPLMTLDQAFDIFVSVGWKIPVPHTEFITEDGGYDMAAVAEAARRAGTLPALGDAREITDSWEAYASNARILDGYQIPDSTVPTRVLLCRSEVGGSWAETLGHSSATALDVDHFALLEAPNDQIVCRWLVGHAEDLGRAMIPLWVSELGVKGPRGLLAWQAVLSAVGLFLASALLALYWLSDRHAALTLGASSAACMAATPLAARLIRLVGPRRFAILSCLSRGVLFIALPLVGGGWWTVSLVLVIGVCEAAAFSVYQLIITDVVGKAARTQALAIRRTLGNVGFSAGGVAAGVVIGEGSTWAYHCAFVVCGIFLIVAALFWSGSRKVQVQGLSRLRIRLGMRLRLPVRLPRPMRVRCRPGQHRCCWMRALSG